MSKRLYNNKYKEWIKKVFTRDGFRCLLCKSTKKLQAHHIYRYCDSHTGRLSVNNGATLCKKCHMEKVTGNETRYVTILVRKIRRGSNS